MSFNRQELIKKYYYDPETGFVGINRLYKKLKPHGISKNEIKEFMKKQETVQITKKQNRKQRSFIPKYPLQEFQADLIYFDPPDQKAPKYGLSVIDVFTKRGHIELLSKKDNSNIVNALKNTIEILGKPDSFYFDEGTEFNNSKVKKFLSDNNIKSITTFTHAPFVERFNRTIKEMFEKYMIAHKTKNIVNVVDKLVTNYNNSHHSVIGMAPNEVNEDNMHIVQRNIINHSSFEHKPPVTVGDSVRVKKKDEKLRKGYKSKYTTDVFKITKVDPPYYYIENDPQPYLRTHLQKVNEIEKLDVPDKPNVKRITRRGKEYLIPTPSLKEKREPRSRKPKYLIVDEDDVAIVGDD